MQAAELARALGAKRSGRQYSCKCPAHDDHNPSLIFWDGHTSLQVRCLAGCEPLDVIAALRRRGLWTNGERENPSPRKLTTEKEQEWNRKRALAIFDEAGSISNTAAEYYLAMRGLYVPAELNGSLARFHPNCPRGKAGERRPALVVLMRGLHNDARGAIQRIFITRDYKKDGDPMMFGPAKNCAMKVGPVQRVAPPKLYISEGFETALYAHALGYTPVWALGSAGAVQRFPLIDGIEQLWIVWDHDSPGGGAALEVGERYGERAHYVSTNQLGTDLADLAREQNEDL